MLASLNESDRAFLGALRDGQAAAEYARTHGYSTAWAKWKSKQIRAKLGVQTIGEAVTMSSTENENGVSRADFEKLTGLVGKLASSIEDLIERPSDQGAQQQVVQRELDVKDHAKALGLSVEDVTKLLEEKDYEKFRRNADRLEAERVAAETEEEETEEAEEGTSVLDGLGGIGNLVRGKRT